MSPLPLQKGKRKRPFSFHLLKRHMLSEFDIHPNSNVYTNRDSNARSAEPIYDTSGFSIDYTPTNSTKAKVPTETPIPLGTSMIEQTHPSTHQNGTYIGDTRDVQNVFLAVLDKIDQPTDPPDNPAGFDFCDFF